jgi:hypothetical protein
VADVTIGTIDTETARGRRAVVFVTDQIGYQFSIASTGQFVWQKTTNGGVSWGSGLQPDSLGATTAIAFDVWFDQWTPGDTGTLIHLWWFNSTADDVYYRTIDTGNSDALGTLRVVFAGATAVAGRGAFVSGTKTGSGYLYCAYDIDAGAERGFHRSTDGGTTWSANLSTTFVEATLDEVLLFPAMNTGDLNDCLAIYYDVSVFTLTMKLWDSSGAVAGESGTILNNLNHNTTDLVAQFNYAASIRHSDGKLFLVADNSYDVATADRVCWELDCTGPAAFTITPKTNITTNIANTYYPQVFIDQTTGDIYVPYNGARTGLEALPTATKVYYTKSTDGGTTWTAGDTAYMEGAAAAVVQVWTPLMGPRFYVTWRTGTSLLGNAVNSLTFGGGAPQILITATMSAAGSMAAEITATRQLLATMSSTGVLTSAITVQRAMSATMPGQATVLATIGGVLGMFATMNGSGSLAAPVRGVRLLDATSMNGAAIVQAVLIGLRTLTATMNGSAVMTAEITRLVRLLATMNGAGSFVAPLTGLRPIAVTLSGTATLQAIVTGLRLLDATVNGSGSLAAPVTRRVPVTATMQGAGELSASFFGGTTVPMAATIPAGGTLAAALTGTRALGAILDGSGALSAPLSSLVTLSATAEGQAILEAPVTRQRAVDAMLEGSGSMVAGLSGVLLMPEAIFIGQGALTALFDEGASQPPQSFQVTDRSLQRLNVIDAGGVRFILTDYDLDTLDIRSLDGHTFLVH